MSESSVRRVAIVGGGLAAMSAAEHLAMATCSADHPRYSIDLLEAKRRTGGRAGSFAIGDANEVDYCQHVAMGCCDELLGLLRRSGLIDDWQEYRELSFRHPDHRPSRFRPSRWLPPPLHLAPTLWNMRYLTIAQKARLALAMGRLMRTSSDELADVTAGQWLRRMKQDETTIERFWEVILVSALGESIDAVSMAVARKVIVDGFAVGPDASSVWVPRRTLAELFGERLPDYLRAQGVAVHTGQPIQEIDSCDSGFRLSFADGQSKTYDACIVAVPWHRLSSVLSGHLADAIHSDRFDVSSVTTMPSSPITGIHLWFDREITNAPHAVMVGTTAQWMFRAPVINEDPHYYQVVISASHAVRGQDKGELIDTVLREIRHEFPDAVGAELVQSRVVTDPKSVFSATPAVEAIRPESATDVPGLALAGDWIRTGWPATMEGAVISGRMAAEVIGKLALGQFATVV